MTKSNIKIPTKAIKVRRGLNLPIKGAVTSDEIIDKTDVKRVALLGGDYVGMKPTMLIKEGENVKLGQPLFEDKKQPGMVYTSPGAGKVVEINRGDKRVFISIVIELSGQEEETFQSYGKDQLGALSADDVKANLRNSGLWSALRTRPYSKTADFNSSPNSIFITAIDSNPLAPAAAPIINARGEDFISGIKVLSRLTEGPTFVCKREGASLASDSTAEATTVAFSGKHPAGNVGTHIHFLDPVSDKKTVWHIGYQDVIAIGHLFTTGKILTERTISIAGPTVQKPMLVKTRMGASLEELTDGNLEDVENRIISGSVLAGVNAFGPYGYLGRYHNQVSVLKEGRERIFLGWQSPGFNMFSVKRIYVSGLIPGKKFSFTTTTNGSPRAMVPIGMYEKIMPLDILPTQLLRSILVGDTETAVNLGALELDEEDLALCTFVCPGKTEYGPILRENLVRIEKGE